jgi:hypothetical protein
MSAPRDIERVLDAWFEPGPTEMPDRLLDDVLAHIETVPQRRLAQPIVRFAEMNTRTRWLTLAAAIAVVAVGVAALVNRPNPGSVGGNPSPSVRSSEGAASPVPAGLIGEWMGAPKDLPGIQDGAGTTLVFMDGEVWLTQSNQVAVHQFTSGTTSAGPNEIEVTSRVAGGGCSPNDSGSYAWSLSPGGRVLTVGGVTDDCTTRATAFEGTWWKMDCPTPDDGCLGDLEAGTYASQYLDPFVAAGDPWALRFGALTYTVPAGWSNKWDWPDHLSLVPQGAAEDTGIFVLTDVVVVSQADPCNPVPDPLIGTTADQIADWLESAPGVVVSASERVTIGGLTGRSLEVALDPSWTTACEFTSGTPARGLFTNRTDGGFHYVLLPTTLSRFYLLDAGDGRAILINIGAESPEDATAIRPEAEAIVQSFEFNR